jgi:hypothetical protein
MVKQLNIRYTWMYYKMKKKLINGFQSILTRPSLNIQSIASCLLYAWNFCRSGRHPCYRELLKFDVQKNSWMRFIKCFYDSKNHNEENSYNFPAYINCITWYKHVHVVNFGGYTIDTQHIFKYDMYNFNMYWNSNLRSPSSKGGSTCKMLIRPSKVNILIDFLSWFGKEWGGLCFSCSFDNTCFFFFFILWQLFIFLDYKYDWNLKDNS